MSDLGGVYHIKNCRLTIDPGTSYSRNIQLDELDVFVIPNVRTFTKKKDGEIVQFVNKVRLEFFIAAGVFVDNSSHPQKDFVDIYQDLLNLPDVTLYPDATKTATGDGFSVVPILERYRLEQFRRGTRSLAYQLKFQTKTRIDVSALSFFTKT
jgi:hypothetical protein